MKTFAQIIVVITMVTLLIFSYWGLFNSLQAAHTAWYAFPTIGVGVPFLIIMFFIALRD